jgi:Pyruvate/2-oxoglutarate dehydrogenase complex, dihydrolipoamide dehydrogenase (E3) component, and related enzymes
MRSFKYPHGHAPVTKQNARQEGFPIARTEKGEEKDYDLIVIGTGNAGMRMSLDARRVGWRVAIVDALPYGGTCALRGCIPKKILTGAVEGIDRVNALQGRGISGTVRVVWPDLIRFKRSFTDAVPAIREDVFRRYGIDAYPGQARFIGRNALRIGEETRTARFIGIATGAFRGGWGSRAKSS